MNDRYGNPLTTNSAKAAELYVDGLDAYLSGNVGDLASLESAVSADNRFAVAHAMLARLRQFVGDIPGSRASLAAARASLDDATRRERQHVNSIGAAIESPPTAKP